MAALWAEEETEAACARFLGRMFEAVAMWVEENGHTAAEDPRTIPVFEEGTAVGECDNDHRRRC